MRRDISDPVPLNILGELLWHSVTRDASILDVSDDHLLKILRCSRKHLPEAAKPRFLEVAAYAHVTGYLLADRHGWSVTLSDISMDTLALGADIARKNALNVDLVERVAADFHELPFETGAFDFVYIASALHHTRDWKRVLDELLRVTAPGGVLYLQNEPCKREFCFYGFPANRPERFRPIEAALDEVGLLRTVAEPFPGSRPESLFGMIENQAIPLNQLIGCIRDHADLLERKIDSDACMSDLDRSILSVAESGRHVRDLVRDVVLKHLNSVSSLLSETDEALGIKLPSVSDVDAMAGKLEIELSDLGHEDETDREVQIGRIFGAAVTLACRKHGNGLRSPSPNLRFNWGKQRNVILGYPPAMQRLLQNAFECLPDIQVADPALILQHFPPDAWALSENAGLRYMALTAERGDIRFSGGAPQGRLLVLVRVHGYPLEQAFEVSLIADERVIAVAQVLQTDSFLLRAEVPGLQSAASVLSIRIHGIHGDKLNCPPTVTIASARVLRL